MPCNGGYGPGSTTVYVESGKQTSRLCAVFSVLESMGQLDLVLNQADWKEAGVSKESTRAWWTRHKEEDRQRRQREAEKSARDKARRAVLSKLSPAEKKILGIKE
jgi:hypothetical protein